MVLLAYGLGRYAEYGDPTTFDEYRKRVQCDLRLKSLFYCVPFQTVRQIQFSRPPLLVLTLKTPGGGLGGLRRALDRTALLDWQGGEYELVAVLNHVMGETHYTACVRYDQSWFKCDDFPLAVVAKVSPLLQQTQTISLFTCKLLVLPIRSVHLLSCHRLEFRLGWVLRVCRVQCLHL